MLNDFLGYSLFSTLEYLGIFYMIFTLFSLHPSYHIIKLVTMSLIISILSYICVVFKIYDLIPAPLITILTISMMIHFIIRKKVVYSFVITGAGVAIAAGIQLSTTGLFLLNNFLSIEQLSHSFGIKTYVIQSINTFAYFSISLISHHTHGRFGYSFRKGNEYKKFVVLALLLVVTISIFFIAFSFIDTTELTYLFLFIVVVLSAIIFLYLSNKQDEYEFK
ncbi:hypothetical protein PBN151_1306 [Paenibacillus sp. NAIST15-1]|nr:hypothetical protein PBN151_1306 [Paenibacillus sp. NAIST15-1]